RLLRKPALRAELGRGDSQFHHLGENFLGIELVAPSRHFTYAPTDGCGSDSHDFLPILRCLCSDAFSSAAASPARRVRSGLTVPPLGRQAGFVGLAQG